MGCFRRAFHRPVAALEQPRRTCLERESTRRAGHPDDRRCRRRQAQRSTMRAVADVFPDKIPIDRTSTNAWADIREAVEATGRKTLLMAGLWTEVCLAQTAIAALADGYRVFFVSDCSGGLTVESHEDVKRRLVQAGATPINWVGVVCEWAPDFTSDERHKVNLAVMKNGAGVGLALEQAFAQS